MSSTNNNTPGNASSYRDLVEADKRTILERVLNSALPKSKSTNAASASSVGKSASPAQTQTTDYDAIFGEDVDDSDQLWEDIMRRAKEEFEKQKEFKKNFPKHPVLQQIFKKPAAKKSRKTAVRRNSKAVENNLAVMNNFKKRLLGPIDSDPEPEPPTKVPAIRSFKNDYNKFKSSIKIISQGNQPQNKSYYPTWKRTETYTPTFSVTTNPNFAKERLDSAKTNLIENFRTPAQKKLYTPGHIDSWMDAATSSHFTEPPSCKSIRSDVAVHDSDSDDDSIKSIENSSMYFSPIFNKNIASRTPIDDCKTPPPPPTKNTMSSSTPMKSTTVRFRPSPPEYFVYGSDGNSSISSDPNFVEENEYKSPVCSPPNYNGAYQNHHEHSFSLQNSPLSLENNYSPCKENIEYEEHHRFYSTSTHHDTIHNIMSNNSMKKPIFVQNFDDSMKKPMFVEDFARKLSNNVSNRYKMELEYSMKVKYYK